MRQIAHFTGFSDPPKGWAGWSPRAQIAPAFSIDPRGGRDGKGALKIAIGANSAQIGAWRTTVMGIKPNQPYRIAADCRCENIKYIGQCVSVRLHWQDKSGKRVREPDNATATSRDGDWRAIDYCVVSPENAFSLMLELEFRWSAGGSVMWDRIGVTELDELPKKLVRLATIHHRPRGTKSAAESVAAFWRIAQANAGERADLLCLPEGITVVGNGKKYVDVAEPIPGPTTQTIAALAKDVKSNIVAGIYERVGELVYNTAVLVSRTGELIGKYRKTHLPQEEVEGGITPGDSYPVFDTDIGRLGLIICWDLQFPEPSRAMAVQGAQILALPIWGGSETLAHARAIENHAFLVSSSYDMRSFVLDPMGRILAEATAQRPFALAEVDLIKPIYQPWLSDMRYRTWKERRADLAGRNV